MYSVRDISAHTHTCTNEIVIESNLREPHIINGKAEVAFYKPLFKI